MIQIAVLLLIIRLNRMCVQRRNATEEEIKNISREYKIKFLK